MKLLPAAGRKVGEAASPPIGRVVSGRFEKGVEGWGHGVIQAPTLSDTGSSGKKNPQIIGRFWKRSVISCWGVPGEISVLAEVGVAVLAGGQAEKCHVEEIAPIEGLRNREF